jgi:alpha-methylacyl-CoA racemase
MQAGDEGGPRGTNLLDGGAPYYQVYETADDAMVAFGAIEPHFYAQMLEGLGLDPAELSPQTDRSQWPALRARIATIVRGRSRAEWVEIFSERDACFTPIVEPGHAIEHPHNAARGSFVRSGGLVQPAPAPRFSRTAGRIGPTTSCHPGEHSDEVVKAWGVDPECVKRARASGAFRQA